MVVLDCSVICKWFVLEEDSNKARSLIEAHLAEDIRIFIPRILFYEIGNVFRYKHLTDIRQKESFEALKKMELSTIDPTFEELFLIGRIASDKELSFYDASYVWLAKHLRCTLVTADRKLANKITGVVEVETL